MSDATAGQVNRVLDEVHRVQNLVAELDDRVGYVSGQVNGVSDQQRETRNDLAQLRQDFLQFVRQAELTANVQRAETRLGTLQDELDHEFGHHKVVRSSAVGMLQAFDSGLVSQETVRDIGEQLMVQTPRYWLAPALVALTAWSGDDQSLCQRAVEEAFRRSPSRTSLFFSLVLRRQGRQDSAVRWLRHYLGAQDPNALGREFAVILEAVAQGAFGPAGRELISERLDEWGDLLQRDDAVIRAQVERWRHEVESHRAAPAGADFPRLATVSPEWPFLEAALSAAEAHAALVARYSALLSQETPVTAGVEDAADDILDRLVSEYDTEELPLRRELVKVQAVIETRGDLVAAEAKADIEVVALDQTLDYLTIQSTAALQPADLGLSTATQKLSVASCSEWFGAAHGEFTRDYRAELPTDVRAQLSASHTFGAAVFQLPAWTGSFTTPMPELEGRLTQHWDSHTAPFLKALEFDLRSAALVPAIVTVLVLVLGVAAAGLGGLLVAAVVGGVWAFKINQAKKAADANHTNAVQVLTRAKTESIAQLRGAGAELTDWSSRYGAADAQESELRQLLEDFARAGQAGNPFERRTVEI